MTLDEDIARGVEALSVFRQDIHFEALYQGFVHICDFRDPVETVAEEHLGAFASEGQSILLGHMLDYMIRGSKREALALHVLYGKPFDEDDIAYFRVRGFLTSDYEVNPFMLPYLEWIFGVYKDYYEKIYRGG